MVNVADLEKYALAEDKQALDEVRTTTAAPPLSSRFLLFISSQFHKHLSTAGHQRVQRLRCEDLRHPAAGRSL